MNVEEEYRRTLVQISQYRTWHPEHGSVWTAEARLASGVLKSVEDAQGKTHVTTT